jgi:UDP:flavonoid glycosyltransferase YjiC (YdhE family)
MPIHKQAGLYLDPGQLTSAGIRQATEMVLANPSVTTGLRQIRRSFEEAGGVKRAADAIQGFKKTRNID